MELDIILLMFDLKTDFSVHELRSYVIYNYPKHTSRILTKLTKNKCLQILNTVSFPPKHVLQKHRTNILGNLDLVKKLVLNKNVQWDGKMDVCTVFKKWLDKASKSKPPKSKPPSKWVNKCVRPLELSEAYTRRPRCILPAVSSVQATYKPHRNLPLVLLTHMQNIRNFSKFTTFTDLVGYELNRDEKNIYLLMAGFVPKSIDERSENPKIPLINNNSTALDLQRFRPIQMDLYVDSKASSSEKIQGDSLNTHIYGLWRTLDTNHYGITKDDWLFSIDQRADRPVISCRHVQIYCPHFTAKRNGKDTPICLYRHNSYFRLPLPVIVKVILTNDENTLLYKVKTLDTKTQQQVFYFKSLISGRSNRTNILNYHHK